MEDAPRRPKASIKARPGSGGKDKEIKEREKTQGPRAEGGTGGMHDGGGPNQTADAGRREPVGG